MSLIEVAWYGSSVKHMHSNLLQTPVVHEVRQGRAIYITISARQGNSSRILKSQMSVLSLLQYPKQFCALAEQLYEITYIL